MISILCPKHQAEYRQNMIDAGYPEYISNKTHGHLPDEILDELIVNMAKAGRVDNENCSSCSIIGLSKNGLIEELQSPDDWMFS